MSYAILWNCNYFWCKNEFMMEIMFPLNSSEDTYETIGFIVSNYNNERYM